MARWSQPHSPRQSIAIVGGGFCGATLAANLVRRGSDRPTQIILIEQNPHRLARGTAYSTTHPDHLLNVPAGRMSAWTDKPDHFVEWAQAVDPAICPDAFVPRRLYGQYLQSLLDQAHTCADGLVQLEGRVDQVLDLRFSSSRQMFTVHLQRSGPLQADHVVLALGNFPPAHPGDAEQWVSLDDRYVRDPWTCDSLALIEPDDHLLLIGSGLTMVDVATALQARGHRGTLTSISLRGLLPQAHRQPACPPDYHFSRSSIAGWPRSGLGLLRRVREEVRRAAAQNLDWRTTINALRPVTAELWRSLELSEQARFLRHLRVWWDVHRHRMPGAQAAAIQKLRTSGRLQVIAGRIHNVEKNLHHLQARIQLRGSTKCLNVRAAWAINCTGPASDLSRVDDPLIKNMLASGVASVDPLRLGLQCDEHGSVIGAAGRCTQRLWALGSLRRGQLWESTAVPELRIQVEALAERLAASSSTSADAMIHHNGAAQPVSSGVCK